MKQRMIDFLLTHANPSIQLRIKKEILRTITAQEEKALQEQILDEKIIRFIGEKQQANGWIGLGFHGSSQMPLSAVGSVIMPLARAGCLMKAILFPATD